MPIHSVSTRWRVPAALIGLALLFACLKGRSPTDASANEVRFDLSAQVSGGTVLHITVVYIDQPALSDVPVPVVLLDQRINVAAGTQRLPLTIDLTRCLADPQHVIGSTCELFAGVVLEQNGQAVDSVGVGPVTVTPGQVVHANTSLVPVGHIDVSPKTVSLTPGAITVLTDSVFSPTNAYLPNATVTWASANSAIAKVNQNGAVTGVSAGTTTVTASAGGQSGSATITVSSVTAADTIVINVPGGLPGISFSAQTGATIPVHAPLEITSKNTAVISGLASSITYTSGPSTGWLIANVSDSVSNYFGQRIRGQRVGGSQIRRATSGSSFVTPGVVDIVPNTTNLTTGTYTATVTVSGSNAVSASITVTYSITASTPTPVLAFKPNPVVFNQYAYGSTVAPLQTVKDTNTGTGTLGPLSAIGTITYTGPDAGWISVAAASATTATGQPNTTFLHLGSDTASIPISATGASNNPVTLRAIVNTYVTYSKVVLGSTFGCGLTTAGTVYCWGGSGQGELGDGGPDLGVKTPVRANLPYSSTNPVIDIEAGNEHACALMQNGTLFCWGYNNHGQVGNGTTTSPAPVTQLPGTFAQITLGALHTCAIMGTPPLAGANYVYCWGDNTYGEYGNNSLTQQTTPTNTGLIYYQLSAGNGYTCGINNPGVAGNLYCWGSDANGVLGNGYSIGNYTAPQQAQVLTVTGGPAIVTSVSAGNTNTCAIDNAGNGYCWGSDQYGQIGNGTSSTNPVVTPTLIPGGYSWTSISVGFTSVCGIAASGDFCWGYDNYGQIGNGVEGAVSYQSPTAIINSGAGMTELTVGQGSQSACYIKGGAVDCFGFDSNGQLGDGGVVTTTSSDTPVPMTAQPAPSGVGPSRVTPRPPVVTRRPSAYGATTGTQVKPEK